MSIAQFWLEDGFNPEFLKLTTKAERLKTGRILYEYHTPKHHYWLKTQLPNKNVVFERAFQQEIFAYAHISKTMPSIFLDYAVANLNFENMHGMFGHESLVLPHVEYFFNDNPFFLSTDQIMHKIIQALCALEILHIHEWVHGDLKADHFCIDRQNVKILDFEQCFHFDKNIEINMTATPRYMAPELFHGEAKSKASDVYALGIILLEWLMQKRLKSKSYYDWAVLHCQKLEIQLSEQFLCFKPMLKSMLEKDKRHRLIDFSALKKLLILNVV
jgi:serine/threonine protein kinase